MEKKLCRPPPLPSAERCERPSRMHSKPRRYPVPKPWQKHPREPSARTPARVRLSDFDFVFIFIAVLFFFLSGARERGARDCHRRGEGRGSRFLALGCPQARAGVGGGSAPGARGAGARASRAPEVQAPARARPLRGLQLARPLRAGVRTGRHGFARAKQSTGTSARDWRQRLVAEELRARMRVEGAGASSRTRAGVHPAIDTDAPESGPSRVVPQPAVPCPLPPPPTAACAAGRPRARLRGRL